MSPKRPPDCVRCAPDQPRPGRGVLRQREKRRATPHHLAVRRLKPEAHRPRDPVAKAQTGEIVGPQALLHHCVAAPVIGDGEVERPARADDAGKIVRKADIVRSRAECGFRPAVEGDMTKRGIEKPPLRSRQIAPVFHVACPHSPPVDNRGALCYRGASCNGMQL